MVSAKTPRERELAREELILHADKHKFSTDSRIHVLWCDDDVQVVLPRAAHADIYNDFIQDNPVQYTPFSTTVQAVYDTNNKNTISVKETQGHHDHLIINEFIANSRTSTSSPTKNTKQNTFPTNTSSTTTSLNPSFSEGAPEGVKLNPSYSEGAPKGVKLNPSYSEGAPKGVKLNPLYSRGALKSVNPNPLSSRGAPKGVRANPPSSGGAPKGVN